VFVVPEGPRIAFQQDPTATSVTNATINVPQPAAFFFGATAGAGGGPDTAWRTALTGHPQ